MKVNSNKSEKGITLIALVITIIVLLILAGVTIATLTGDNGILTKASEAKEENEIEGLKEQAELVKTSLLIEEGGEYSKLNRLKLAENIQKELGGNLKGPKVTTEDYKYDIYVKSDLEIIVEKHIEETLNEEFVVEELEDGTISIIQYTGNSSELNIPRELEIDGSYKTVSQLGNSEENNIIDWKNAFLTKINLPDTLKVIDNYALYGCFEVNSDVKIELPEGLLCIGEGAFQNNGITSINIPTTVNEVRDFAFSGNKLKEIDIPKTITKIPQDFASYNEITEVIIPQNITYIANCAFMGNKISNLNIPSTVKTIEYGAFTDNLLPEDKAYIYARNADGSENNTNLISYGGYATDITIPDSVKNIAKSALMYCDTINSINTNNVKTIEAYALSHCNSLITLNINTVLTSVGTGCASYCTNLKNVTLPEGQSIIGKNMFSQTGIETIILPNSITSIGEQAFEYCEKLGKVIVSNQLSKIGKFAFQRCTSLTEISLPSTIISIDDTAFISCTTTININKTKDSVDGAPWGVRQPGKIIWKDGETLGE